MTRKPAPGSLPKTIVAAAPTTAAMAKAVITLQAEIPKLERELLKAGRDPVTLARAYVAMHRLNERVDLLGKEWGALYDSYKKETLPNALQAAGITNVPLAEGFRVGYSTKTFASIKEGMKDGAFAWLRKNKLKELIVETVYPQSLSKAAAYRIEEQNLTLPDDLFNVHPVFTTSVTSTKARED